jgi:hypothetical protein
MAVHIRQNSAAPCLHAGKSGGNTFTVLKQLTADLGTNFYIWPSHSGNIGEFRFVCAPLYFGILQEAQNINGLKPQEY